MDELFDRRGFLKKATDPPKMQEFLELISGSEEDFNDFTDENPTLNPDELEAYTSLEEEDDETVLPLCSISCNSQKGRQNDTSGILILKANSTATDAENIIKN